MKIKFNECSNFINPFSHAYRQQARKFNTLKHPAAKVCIVAATLFCTLLTLPLLGVGGIIAFRAMMGLIKQPKQQPAARQENGAEQKTAKEKASTEAAATEQARLHNIISPSTTSSAAAAAADISPNTVFDTPDLRESAAITAPEVMNNRKKGLFVDVLNANGYRINGTLVTFSPAGSPRAVAFQPAAYEEQISRLLQGRPEAPAKVCEVVDKTTEEAIAEENGHAKIALNFANEVQIGGHPGIEWAPEQNGFVYSGPSARAQEESLCQHSDLMASLIQLSNEDPKLRKMSYRKGSFDSKITAYVSENHLFGLTGENFYAIDYLAKPVAVSFITSSAPCYNGQTVKQADANLQQTRQRICVHLIAAADEAVKMRQELPDRPVEVILGAFGCGVFSAANRKEYATLVAEIYREELNRFGVLFDRITFALPTFKQNSPQNPAVINYNAFSAVLS